MELEFEINFLGRLQISACVNNYTIKPNEYEIVLAYCNKWNTEVSVGSNAFIKEDEIILSFCVVIIGKISEEY